MPELAMAPAHADLSPAVGFEDRDGLSHVLRHIPLSDGR